MTIKDVLVISVGTVAVICGAICAIVGGAMGISGAALALHIFMGS